MGLMHHRGTVNGRRICSVGSPGRDECKDGISRRRARKMQFCGGEACGCVVARWVGKQEAWMM